MRLQVDRVALAEAVAWAARSLPTRPALPVLAGLMLEADDNTLRLAGFDYELSARVEIPADVQEPGSVLVSGRLLADITRSLPARTVEMAIDGTRVTVTSGSSRFVLLSLPLEDYPTLPELPAASGTIDGAALASAVAQVTIAAGRDDTLPVLTGVRIEVEGETLTLAATDRYRLSIREIGWRPEQTNLSTAALVPARTLADAAKAFAAADKVTVALVSEGRGEGLIGFEGAGRRTTARLLDGQFPAYRSLLPSTSSTVATVETAAFAEAVRRVALVAERTAPIRLGFADSALTLEAGGGDDAQATESMPAFVDGEPIEIAFNPGFLLDGLGALDTPFAQLSFTAPSKPAVLVGRLAQQPADGEAAGDSGPQPGAEADEFRHLLMPVRLSG